MSKSSSNMFYLGFFLCAVCAAATAVMGGAALLTKGPIEKSRSRKVTEALHKVLPPFDNDVLSTVRTVDSVRFYTAEKQGRIVGYAGELSVNSGYGGRIAGLISFHPEGRIRTFVITQHSETPGLGSAVADRVNAVTLYSLFRGRKITPDGKLPPNRILDQYTGHTLTLSDSWKRPWKLIKDGGDVQYITGATISSRAVNDLAWKAAQAFGRFKASGTKAKSINAVNGAK